LLRRIKGLRIKKKKSQASKQTSNCLLWYLIFSYCIRGDGDIVVEVVVSSVVPVSAVVVVPSDDVVEVVSAVVVAVVVPEVNSSVLAIVLCR
jgi:hypothetical protein